MAFDCTKNEPNMVEVVRSAQVKDIKILIGHSYKILHTQILTKNSENKKDKMAYLDTNYMASCRALARMKVWNLSALSLTRDKLNIGSWTTGPLA